MILFYWWDDMDNLVELQVIDDFIEPVKSNVKYPHILIDGVTTEQEVMYFHKKFVDKEKALPLYMVFSDMYKCIGHFELTLNNLLTIRSIAPYNIKLVMDDNTSIPIDLGDPTQLIKFINIGG